MSFSVSSLQSIIKRNSNQITNLENTLHINKSTVRTMKSLGMRVPDSFYKNQRNFRKQIDALARNQRELKQEMKILLKLKQETNLNFRYLSSDKGWKIDDLTKIILGDKNRDVEIHKHIFDAESNSSGIGDVNSNERGSGARFNTGKPDYSLIPLVTMEDEARVWEYGKKKYAAWNWTKGMKWSVPLACAIRHLSKWQIGEENDVESGLPHMAHAMCNLRMLTYYSKFYQEGDDRPKEFFKHD